MTLQLNNHLRGPQHALPLDRRDIRRDPLTGELVSLAAAYAGEPNSRLRALTANAEPLETEKLRGESFDAVPNPLSHLSSAPGHRPQSPIVSENISVFGSMTAHNAELLLDEYIARFEELVPRADVSELTIHEHHAGIKAFATLEGFSEPTELTEIVNFHAERWAKRRAADLLSDVLVAELVDRRRVLVKTKHWVAFVPYAASSPLHIMVLPKAPRRNLVAMTDEEQQDLAQLHQLLSELISKAVATPHAAFAVLWSMAPIPHCRSISRMRVEYTSASAGVSYEESPEELAYRLRSLI